jgi:hypothetical protein
MVVMQGREVTDMELLQRDLGPVGSPLPEETDPGVPPGH